MNEEQVKKLLENIALKHLSVETLETRNMDDLDFHDCCVAGIKNALEAAFKAGLQAGVNAK